MILTVIATNPSASVNLTVNGDGLIVGPTGSIIAPTASIFGLFSAGPWCGWLEVGSGPLTGGLVGGFMSVVRPLGLDRSRVAA